MPTPTTFLTLPAEIRYLIYEAILSDASLVLIVQIPALPNCGENFWQNNDHSTTKLYFAKHFKRIIPHDYINLFAAHSSLYLDFANYATKPIIFKSGDGSTLSPKNIVFQVDQEDFMRCTQVWHPCALSSTSQHSYWGDRIQSFINEPAEGRNRTTSRHFSIYFEVIGPHGTHYRVPYSNSASWRIIDMVALTRDAEQKLMRWWPLVQNANRHGCVGRNASIGNTIGEPKFYVQGPRGPDEPCRECRVKSRDELVREGAIKFVYTSPRDRIEYLTRNEGGLGSGARADVTVAARG